MKFTLAAPDIRAAFKGVEADLAATVTAGMRDATTGLKTDLRASVTGAGLGQRVANAWRGKTYPQGQDSLEPAAFVYSNAAKIIESFNNGAVIRSRFGKFLTIPSQYAGVGTGGKHLTPGQWEARTGVRLQFVREKNGKMFLKAILRLRTGKKAAVKGTMYTTPTKSTKGRDLFSVIIFFLVPSAKIPKKFDIQSIADDWAARVPGLIDAHWKP